MSESVRIERAVYGGAGLAHRTSGAVAFVPFVLPEELVEIDAPSGTNEAALQRVIEPAPTRIEPPCPHFGRCGGCQYQHAEYAVQVAIKRDILRETMQRAGVDALPEIANHTGEPWGYRNRVRFRLGKVEGAFRVGYSVRGTNAFLPITQCPIAAPLLWKAAVALLQLSESHSEARLWLEAANEVEFFCNADLSRLQMTLLCTRSKPAKKNSFARLCEALLQDVPELSGAGVLTGDARGGNTNFTESWGTAGLAYRVADENYWVSRGGFFQVNRFLVEALLPLVCGGRSGDIAWDLYAGVGLFSRVLARSFAQVTAVEANPSAANDLRISLGKLGSQHRSVQASTLEFLRGAVVQRERPALIVLDPPRAGAGLEACELLLKIAAPAVVYVSCDPTTLARDLVVLQGDYRIAAMHLVDLFPQTSHLETVVMLARR